VRTCKLKVYVNDDYLIKECGIVSRNTLDLLKGKELVVKDVKYIADKENSMVYLGAPFEETHMVWVWETMIEYNYDKQIIVDTHQAMKDAEKILYDNEAGLLVWLERWLKDTGWEVFKEVSSPNGYTDIVATRTLEDGSKIRWGIEGKMSCNCDVIFQAERNKPYYDYVSIATPAEPNQIFKTYLRERSIGCLYVPKWKEDNSYAVYYWGEKAGYNNVSPIDGWHCFKNYGIDVLSTADRLTPKHGSKVELHELQKDEIAGKNCGERLTPYKMSVMKILDYLEGKDYTEINKIVEDIGDSLHWSAVKQGVRKAVMEWERDKFEHTYKGRTVLVRKAK